MMSVLSYQHNPKKFIRFTYINAPFVTKQMHGLKSHAELRKECEFNPD